MTAGTLLWRGAGLATAILVGFGFRAATVWNVRTTQGDSAAVRVSWSARPERIERCRRLSDEELAARPAHMRLRMECEGFFARYLLTLSRNGAVLSSDTIRGGGLRNDRPIHVFEEFAVPAGRQVLRVSLTRIDSVAAAGPESGPAADSAATLLGGREEREADERRRRAGEAIPAALSLDTTVTLAPNQVVLVTWDGVLRRLVARTGP